MPPPPDKMAAPADEAEAVVHSTSPISAWYDNRRPMWIDLVGDYAGRELFLIEGDSLLRQCFDDPRIDFHGRLPHAPHFPFELGWILPPDFGCYYRIAAISSHPIC